MLKSLDVIKLSKSCMDVRNIAFALADVCWSLFLKTGSGRRIKLLGEGRVGVL